MPFPLGRGNLCFGGTCCPAAQPRGQGSLLLWGWSPGALCTLGRLCVYEPDRRRQERGQSQIHLCGARGIDGRQQAQAVIQKTPFKKKKKCCSLCNSKIIEQICLGRGAGRLFLTVSRR